MAAHLTDCPACACLIDSAESACPFCGAAQRRFAMMPAALTLGLALGLANISCNDKPGTTMSDSDTDDSGPATPGAAYAAPPPTEEGLSEPDDESTTGATGDTTSDTTTEPTSGTTGTTGTSSTTSDDTTGFNSVSAYAGAPGGADPLDPPEDLAGR